MRLVEAIRSEKPFRRPSWVNPEDEFQWVVYNPEYGDFEWADDNGNPSGNTFGSIIQLASQNQDATDYEIKYQIPAEIAAGMARFSEMLTDNPDYYKK